MLCLFFRINLVLPHLFLLSLLLMRHCRYLVSDAHVWPAVVVEVDVALDDTVGMLIGVESVR